MMETIKANEEKFNQLYKRWQSASRIFFWLYIILGVPLIVMDLSGSADWSDLANQGITVLILAFAVFFYGGIGYMFIQAGKLGLRPKRE